MATSQLKHNLNEKELFSLKTSLHKHIHKNTFCLGGLNSNIFIWNLKWGGGKKIYEKFTTSN